MPPPDAVPQALLAQVRPGPQGRHALPLPPQCEVSCAVVTQMFPSQHPEQLAGPHVAAWQPPDRQVFPAEHATHEAPLVPQADGSVPP